MTTVRGAAVYWNGGRLGRITEGNYSCPDGGENLVCEDGMLGRSKGVTVSTLSITALRQVSGTAVDNIEEGEVGNVTLSPMGGKVWTAKMTYTHNSGNWTHA